MYVSPAPFDRIDLISSLNHPILFSTNINLVFYFFKCALEKNLLSLVIIMYTWLIMEKFNIYSISSLDILIDKIPFHFSIFITTECIRLAKIICYVLSSTFYNIFSLMSINKNSFFYDPLKKYFVFWCSVFIMHTYIFESQFVQP